MAQTLQNQLLLCKSMNGIISLSDGAGSTISNGQIVTNDLSGNTITTNSFNTTDMFLARKSSVALNTLLGSIIDVDLLIQNLNFNTTTRNFQIWNDVATTAMAAFDVSNNTITFNTLPTSTIVPTTNYSLTNKLYVDNTFGTIPVYVRNDIYNNSFLLGSGNTTLTGGNNFAGGYQALKSLTTGTGNVAIGVNALLACQDGQENFALGGNSMYSLTSGSFNTAVGAFTGGNLTTGISNTFIGRYVGGGLSYQNNNSFIGYFCGVNSSGEGNTCYGAYALGIGCSGSSNTIVGLSAGGTLTGSGSSNTLLGVGADVINGTINNSCAIGAGCVAQASNGIYLGTTNEMTYANGGLTIPSKSSLLNTLSVLSSGGVYTWSFGLANHIIITGTIGSPKIIALPSPTTANIGTDLSISSQDGCFITLRTITGSGFGILDQNGVSQTGFVPLGSGVRYVALKCINTTGNTWQITSVALPNTSLVCDLTSNQTVNGTKTFGSTVVLSNGLNVGSVVSNTALSYTANLSSDAQTQINTVNTKVTDISYDGTTLTTNFANNINVPFINPSATLATDLALGNANNTTKVIGSLTIKNGAQKVGGYSTLSGSPNNLTKPLSEYYTLATTSNGALTLPVIDSSLYGTQVTFVKTSAINTWTINAGTGNTFRLYKSNSTATATSISLINNNTVLRIVAVQATVWDVILTDIFYDAASTWVIGTQYFPLLMNPTNITAVVNWNTSLPTAFYRQQGFSITATVNLTLPQSTNVNVPDGLRIKFRRVGGTLATSLQAVASGTDTIMAFNALATTAAGTAVILVNTGTYWGEIYLNKTTATWYCQ